MPPLALPLLPNLSGDICTSAPLARHESVCFPSGQAHSCGIVQGEDIRSPLSPGSPVLAFPDMVLRVGPPSGGWSVGDSSKERPTVSASGQNLTPTSRDLEVVGMADHRSPLAFDLSDGVCETINSTRALSTRKLYSSKWKVFKFWCLVHAVYPVSCPVGSVLEFLQDKFSAGAAATTLRVYVAAIAARRESNNVPLGRHRLVSYFMRGVKRLRPYMDHSSQWSKSIQLLVCFGSVRKGLAASKHTISHWVRDAISLAYEVCNLPSPLDIRAHSTREVASSQALFRRVPLEDICMAASWSSPNYFVRFYNLYVNTAPGSQVLSVWTSCVFWCSGLYWARSGRALAWCERERLGLLT